MYEEFMQNRITGLRIQKDVSARDMSLSIGQNDSYINRIENKKTLPSMQTFFYICDYLGVTPQEFFDQGNLYPEQLKEIIENLKLLDVNTLANLASIISKLAEEKK